MINTGLYTAMAPKFKPMATLVLPARTKRTLVPQQSQLSLPGLKILFVQGNRLLVAIFKL
jgi:hypothetical protein